MTTALQILVIVTLIGILAGLAVTRYGRGWFGTRASDFTAALVGIAGAFLGFHIGVAAGLTPVPVADYLVAIVGGLGHALGVAESLTVRAIQSRLEMRALRRIVSPAMSPATA